MAHRRASLCRLPGDCGLCAAACSFSRAAALPVNPGTDGGVGDLRAERCWNAALQTALEQTGREKHRKTYHLRCLRVFFGKVLVLLEGLGQQCMTQ